MTTIRKIVTSQVDGNSANSDINDEIRPFGEASFYIDTSGDTDKLVLSMFEGQRTHLRSKVLSPGVFYGSNADSGDGAGLDTIKLIPDTSLHYNDGNYGNDQYLIVDPTAPNHIHIRAGGTIDNSSADLFIGGEKNFVRVSDNSDDVLISTDDNNDGTKSWTFNSNGDLYVPNYIIFRDGTLIGDEGGATPPVFRIDAPLGFGINFTTDSDIEGANKVWSLGIDGSLTFPDSTIQSTAYTGGRIVEEPTSSAGATGDRVGDLAFSSGYIYYCTENFGGTTYEVLHAISESSANGVDNGYLVTNNYQLPEIGWKVYYNGETSTINQVNNGGVPGFYVVFVDVPLVIPGQALFEWGPAPSANIWKRVAWSNDTW